MFVSHFVSTSSQGSPWVQHMRILRFIVTWDFFNQWKGVKIVCFHAGALKSKKTNCKAFVLQEDASFYFNLKSFSCQVQQEVFLTLVSDIFLNLSFDLSVFSPLFAYLNKLDRSPSITLWYSLVSTLKRQVVFVFICLKISTFLFADTYSLQSKANCMALKRTTSAKSLHDKQSANFNLEFRFWKCSMKILHLCCISVRAIILL